MDLGFIPGVPGSWHGPPQPKDPPQGGNEPGGQWRGRHMVAPRPPHPPCTHGPPFSPRPKSSIILSIFLKPNSRHLSVARGKATKSRGGHARGTCQQGQSWGGLVKTPPGAPPDYQWSGGGTILPLLSPGSRNGAGRASWCGPTCQRDPPVPEGGVTPAWPSLVLRCWMRPRSPQKGGSPLPRGGRSHAVSTRDPPHPLQGEKNE